MSPVKNGCEALANSLLVPVPDKKSHAALFDPEQDQAVMTILS